MKLIDRLQQIAKATGYRLRLEQTDNDELLGRSHVFYAKQYYKYCTKCHDPEPHIIVYYKTYADLLWILAHEVGHIKTSDAIGSTLDRIKSEHDASVWALRTLKPFIRRANLNRGARYLQRYFDSYLKGYNLKAGSISLLKAIQNKKQGGQ
jgi:hypothetical protein